MLKRLMIIPARRMLALTFALAASNSHGLALDTIDDTLAKQEAQFANIKPGLEKHVRWFTPGAKTPYALVYIHGFSASAKEISPVTEKVADALKANAYYVRLRGHARDGDAMAEATVADWKNDVSQAFEIAKLIGDRVILISTSTGGTLSTWLTSQDNDSLERVDMSILVSPNFGLANSQNEWIRWGWGLQLARWLKGDEHFFVPQNELHSLYWTERYPIEALSTMMHLVDEVNEIDVSHVSTPQHFVFSPNDQIIDVEAIHTMADQYSNAITSLNEVRDVEDPGQHVLAGDACSPSTTDAVVQLMLGLIRSDSTNPTSRILE